jgi:hypothetical protein
VYVYVYVNVYVCVCSIGQGSLNDLTRIQVFPALQLPHRPQAGIMVATRATA